MNNINNNLGHLDFEVVPENCLRNEFIELALGTPINHVLSALRNASRVIRNVELIYCNKDPLNREITVILKNDGIRLTFDPKKQVLKLIEVYDFRHISLHYCSTIFSTPQQASSDVSKVESCFGATHPGVYDEKQKMYLLHWRGVSFNFPAKEPSTIHPLDAHGLGSLNFSNSKLPLLERMGVYCGDSPNEMRLPEVPTATHCGNLFPLNIESVSDEFGITGLKIRLCGENFGQSPRKTSELTQKEQIVSFGDSEQSLLASLGAPSRVFYKSDDKMLIQRGSSSESIGNADKPDVFYNYFSLGLDVLLESEKRTVIKFILHTNVPGHYDFGEYVRTSFSIHCNPGRSGPYSDGPCTISTESKLEDFKAAFADPETGIPANPVVVNRAPTNEGENPFGSTFCYGNDQLIVEVMDNGHIATLIVYESIAFDSTAFENVSESTEADEEEEF